MVIKNTKKKLPLLYPIEVTPELVSKVVKSGNSFAKHLKIGWFILVEITKNGYRVQKNSRQYETESSAVKAFSVRNKVAKHSFKDIMVRLKQAGGEGLTFPNVEKEDGLNEPETLTKKNN